MNLLQATEDENLFASWFRGRTTWQAWTAFLAALFGLEMTPEQLLTYQAHTGPAREPRTSRGAGRQVLD